MGWAVVKIARGEVVAATLAVALVLAAFVVCRSCIWALSRPLIHSTPQRIHEFAHTAPIFGCS
jgi:methylthioxylose transferase